VQPSHGRRARGGSSLKALSASVRSTSARAWQQHGPHPFAQAGQSCTRSGFSAAALSGCALRRCQRVQCEGIAKGAAAVSNRWRRQQRLKGRRRVVSLLVAMSQPCSGAANVRAVLF
jgi:hypothetical protein